MSELKLAFVYVPVKDLAAALAFYRDTLGFAEMWREGEQTVGLELPGTEVGLMLVQEDDPKLTPGPIFIVDDVRDYYARNKGSVAFGGEPTEIPPGFMVDVTDPSGNLWSILDTTKERAESA